MKVTAPGTLAARARQLGQQHAAAAIAPFGDAEYVYGDAGSADLMTALGETGPATAQNEPERMAAVEAYCDALGGAAARTAGPDAFAAACSEWLSRNLRLTAEDVPGLGLSLDGTR
jgi:hypothetical protein